MKKEIEREIRKMINVGKRLDILGLQPSTSGNFSSRINDFVVITSSGKDKGNLKLKDFTILTLDGKVISGDKPSYETPIHLSIYKKFSPKSVIHAHTPASTTISILMDKILLSNYELLKVFEKTYETTIEIPVIENDENMERISKVIEKLPQNTYAFIIKAHGIYTWGKDVQDAFSKITALEFMLQREIEIKILTFIKNFEIKQ